MRHFTQAVLLLFLILTLAGCGSGGNSARKTDNGNSVENVINEQIAAAGTEQSGSDTESSGTESNETENSETENNGTGSSETDEDDPETAASTEETAAAQSEENTETAESENVDYDLTAMNSDMVYATVYQMMVDPDSYIGKTVKMSGPFYPYTNEDGSVYYPACIIEDATACCAQGMEFVLSGAEYPDGYPEEGTVITVVGTFETYEEDGYLYCHLKDAALEVESQ